jgi:L-threonylcarbamoyladenylate synthase
VEAAAQLFKFLRELDELPIEMIYSQWLPEAGLGRAINDRLKRASA